MAIAVKTYTGESAKPYQNELAHLRLTVFREFPYLYDGSLTYEKKYLDTFFRSPNSVIVVAFDEDQVVGASTGLPLMHETPNVQAPWIKNGEDISQIFYFSESVLLPAYHGRGIGVRFFEKREAFAKRSGFTTAVFCAVIRKVDDPRRPQSYFPLNQFWKNRGFTEKEGYVCQISWKDIGEEQESEKELQFWYKVL
jgi:GNAT superfamily N-acetyltransferase